MGSLAEDLLDITAHIELLENLIALINDKVLDVGKIHNLVLDGELEHAAGGTDNNVGAVLLEDLAVLSGGDTTEEHGGLDILEELAEALVLVVNLKGKLTGVAEHNHRDLVLDGLKLVESGQNKDGGLTHTRLGLADHILTKHGLGNAAVLHLTGALETEASDGAHQLRLHHEVLKTRGMDTNIGVLLGLVGISLGRLLLDLGLILVVVEKIVVAGHFA
mmetsp:Transcript_19066/g.37424  ORF Transcript_19066/g.37424 Transcript_19066/m.37424 type:complete len:219 (-) Transcript_19066:95-751(-)